jgi:SAM-dependent methyltransferase
MIEFDAAQTAKFFNNVYRQVDLERGKQSSSRLHPRDQILLTNILPNYPTDTRILDYGCGQARLLATLLERGFDAVGMEKHEGMRAIARAETARWSVDRERISAGGIEGLAPIADRTYDFIIAMGVFQYLQKTEYDKTLNEFSRLLKPRGVLVATFQNALFDLFTFNKYTIDFMMQRFVLPYAPAQTAKNIKTDLDALIANHDKPTYAATRARDNIFVHLTNPLTIAKHLREAGFQVIEKYFYEYFGLPPLLATKYDDFAKAIAAKFEIDNATAWEGHFMANAFLIHAVRM